MILPTKHISERQSVLGAGATVLRHLDTPQTVTGLWERVRHHNETSVYSRYILTLDFLFAIGVINLEDGLVTRHAS